jgi:hypothetical protein
LPTIEKGKTDEYEMQDAEAVKRKRGVNLKKREQNKKGEEFIFVDLKTGALGKLSHKKYLDMKFITPTLEEREKNDMKYEKYIRRQI